VSIGNDDRTLELASGSVQLEAGVTLHDMGVKSSRKGDFLPQQITAKVGDVVRFTSRDTRTHALQILAPTPEATTMLQTLQSAAQPAAGGTRQAWVVSLKGLPAGTYTFRASAMLV
jgi:plastocyanin